MTLPTMTPNSASAKLRRDGMSVSPMMTDARPMTIAPCPIVSVALPSRCATSAPERAISALDSISPTIFIAEVLMPCARLMRSFMPVARIALPISVPKNQ